MVERYVDGLLALRVSAKSAGMPQCQTCPVKMDVSQEHVSAGCNRVVGALDWGRNGLVAYAAHNLVILYDAEVYNRLRADSACNVQLVNELNYYHSIRMSRCPDWLLRRLKQLLCFSYIGSQGGRDHGGSCRQSQLRCMVTIR